MSGGIDAYFLKHNVYQDLEDDNFPRPLNSDSEEEAEAVAPCSAADAYSPWESSILEKGDSKGKKIIKSCNSGPKGVINDYKVYKRQKAEEKERDGIIRQLTLERIAKGYIAPSVESSTQEDNSVDPQPPEDEESDDDEFFGDLDNEFLSKYHSMRVQEIKANNLPTFGVIQYVDPFEFVDILQKANPNTKIFVHLYDPSIRDCEEINSRLEEFAKFYNNTQFIVLNASKADNSFSLKDLPVFLVYKDSELIHTKVQIQSRLERNYSEANIEEILQECSIMKP